MSSWNDMKGSASNTLKYADLGGKEFQLTIESWEQKDMSREGEEPSVKVVLSFVGAEKGLALNVGNGDMIASAFGDDPDQWVGKTVILRPDPTVKFKGKVVGGIKVHVPVQDALRPGATPGSAPPVPQPDGTVAPPTTSPAAAVPDDSIPF